MLNEDNYLSVMQQLARQLADAGDREFALEVLESALTVASALDEATDWFHSGEKRLAMLELEQQAGGAAAASTQQNELEQKTAELMEERYGLLVQVGELNEENTKLAQQLLETETQRDELERANAALQQQVQELQERCDYAKKQLQEAADEFAKLHDDYRELRESKTNYQFPFQAPIEAI